jgi:hypothetical protein
VKQINNRLAFCFVPGFSKSSEFPWTMRFRCRQGTNSGHRIQERAYQLFIEHGKQPGREMENWILAEREFAGQPKARSAQFAG